MFQVNVMVDVQRTGGHIEQAIAEDLIETAEQLGAEVTSYRNGVKAIFPSRSEARHFHTWVTHDPEIKRRLAGTSYDFNS